MNTSKLKELLKERAQIDAQNDVLTEQSHNEQFELLSNNLQETMVFLNTCTPEEIYWVSELFERLSEHFKSQELIVGGKSRKIDLLFYHIRLRCYVVCELKAREFEPEFAGKLNFYVNAVDELLKHDDENPTIGLLICSDMNKADVQWSFKGISTPMGVATYNNVRIQDVLPTQEQLKERMELLQKELRETKRLMNKCTE